jgi:hypothetical protein
MTTHTRTKPQAKPHKEKTVTKTRLRVHATRPARALARKTATGKKVTLRSGAVLVAPAARAVMKKGSKKTAAKGLSHARILVRRDGTGHLDPAYAAVLHSRSRASKEDHGTDRAFLRESASLRAPLANELGREAVMTMTSAEDQSEQLQDSVLELGEEVGGPFVLTTGGEEFAPGPDLSNPRGTPPEPFPTT